MSKADKNCSRHSSFSPTSPPSQFRSPASGYSKSILSAIKDLPYEHSSGNTSRSSANSANQSPKSQRNRASTSPNGRSKEAASKNSKRTTTILKIKVGQFKEEEEATTTTTKLEDEKQMAEANGHKAMSSSGGSKRQERRSLSCETALPNLAELKIDVPSMATPSSGLSKSQKTLSMNVIDQKGFISPNYPASSIASSRLGSTFSIRSTAVMTPTLSERKQQRSPSATSSICSKDEKSLATSQAKICLSTCSSALLACANGDLPGLRELVKENPELVTYQYPYCYRYSCLHIAAKAGELGLVKFLLKSGANVNAKDDTWSTPLHAAAKAGHVEVIKVLKQNGADTGMIDAHGHAYTSYLPAREKSIKNSTQNSRKKQQPNWEAAGETDGDGLSLGSNRSQHSFGSSTRLNNTFQSFRKPFSRAVRDLLHRK